MDVIVEINGQTVETPNDVTHIIDKFDIGDTIRVKINRRGKRVQLKLKLGELPSPDKLPKGYQFI